MTSEELITALEAATGPSRELDLEILRVVSGKPWRWEPRVDEAITWDRYGPGAVGNPALSLERFTASLDDALTLVPEGFGVELRTYPLAPTGHRHTPMARVLANQSRRDPLRWDEAGIGDAPTPALALCIAALRARSAQQ